MIRWSRFIAALVLLGFLPQATYAQAVLTKPISELPKPTLVQENRATLLERGCVEVVGDAVTQTVAQPADKPVHLYPNDWTAGKYVFCPEVVKSTVTIKEGKVKAFPIIFLLAGILITAYFLPGVSDVVQTVFFWIVRNLLYWAAILGTLIIYFLSDIVDELLVAQNFTTSAFVVRGWPFLQGLANIGFIIALLYVAVLTVLRLGPGVSKLIPKLVIGALLINFSLVIGGVFIDASRVIMAAERDLIGPAPGLPIGMSILTRSEIIQKPFNLEIAPFSKPSLTIREGDSPNPNTTEGVMDMLLAVFLIWVLLVGFFMVAVGLFTRYLGLILLLIVSPVAYAALAIPNLSGLMTKWWQMFLKFVIYGPVAMFILLLLTLIPNVELINNFGTDLLKVGTAIGLMWAVATVAKSYSLAGADKIMGLAKGAAGFAKRHPVLTGVALAGATGGVGAVALGAAGYFGGKRVARQGQDLYEKTRDSYASRIRKNRVGQWILGPERDKEGKLKPGQDSLGSALAKRISPYKSQEGRAAARAGLNAGDPALREDQLLKSSVADALSFNQIYAILTTGSAAQRKALMRHREVVRKMTGPAGDALKSHIMTLPTNTGIDDVDRSNRELKNSLMNHLAEMDKE